MSTELEGNSEHLTQNLAPPPEPKLILKNQNKDISSSSQAHAESQASSETPWVTSTQKSENIPKIAKKEIMFTASNKKA